MGGFIDWEFFLFIYLVVQVEIWFLGAAVSGFYRPGLLTILIFSVLCLKFTLTFHLFLNYDFYFS